MQRGRVRTILKEAIAFSVKASFEDSQSFLAVVAHSFNLVDLSINEVLKSLYWMSVRVVNCHQQKEGLVNLH